MNRVKNFIGAMREKGVRTVKRAVPAFFTAYCYFSYGEFLNGQRL